MISKDIRLVIFDADGTLRRMKSGENRAPLNNDEWELMPGIKEAIENIRHQTITFGIASNQSCVGRGEIKNYQAHVMLNRLARKLNLAIDIEGPCIQMCPHLPGTCSCRKPEPGMIYAIMMFWEVAPRETLFIGDSLSDRKAAENSKCRFMFTKDFLEKE